MKHIAGNTPILFVGLIALGFLVVSALKGPARTLLLVILSLAVLDLFLRREDSIFKQLAGLRKV